MGLGQSILGPIPDSQGGQLDCRRSDRKSYPTVILPPLAPLRNPGPGSVMIVFANAKVATQQIKAAIEGALKLGMEMDLFITRAWGSDSDMPSTFFKIIHNFRNDYRLHLAVASVCESAT